MWCVCACVYVCMWCMCYVIYTCIRDCSGTLNVGMVQVILYSLGIGIAMKFQKELKTTQIRLCRDKPFAI